MASCRSESAAPPHLAGAPQPGSVNPRTGKRYLKAGYAPATINHALTVVASF
ncbi:hypothetical protein AB0L61_38725 [Streptomyces tendae]|uniref:hypothetical protein n=1 Tax=Streptomyces tendae TaxID=1932 RepID=UPI003429B743